MTKENGKDVGYAVEAPCQFCGQSTCYYIACPACHELIDNYHVDAIFAGRSSMSDLTNIVKCILSWRL